MRDGLRRRGLAKLRGIAWYQIIRFLDIAIGTKTFVTILPRLKTSTTSEPRGASRCSTLFVTQVFTSFEIRMLTDASRIS